MVQRRNGPSLALETFVELLANDFDRHGTAQSGVDSPKYLAHPALSDLAFNAVWPQMRTRTQESERRFLCRMWHIPDRRPVNKFAACLIHQKRFHFAAQVGIRLRQQSRALIGRSLANRVV